MTPGRNRNQTRIRGTRGQALQPQGSLRDFLHFARLISQSALAGLNKIIMESLTRPMQIVHIRCLPSNHHMNQLSVKIADSTCTSQPLPAPARSRIAAPAAQRHELFDSVFIHLYSIPHNPVTLEPV